MTPPALPHLFRIKDLSSATGIPENTIRRYTRFFAIYLPGEQHGKRKAYAPECLERITCIQNLYKQGMSTTQIHAELRSRFSATMPPKTPTREKQKRIFAEIASLRKEFLHFQTNLNSQQLQAYQHIKPRLTALETGNTKLQHRVTELEKQNDALKAQNSALHAENTSLHQRLQEAERILNNRELLRKAYLAQC